MKPEHAQEIYEMLIHWAGYVPDWANQKWNIQDDLKRAKKLLGLERPDVPETGMIIEVVTDDICSYAHGHGYGLAWFICRCEDGKIKYELSRKPHLHPYTNYTKKWRYPGEKEWRE